MPPFSFVEVLPCSGGGGVYGSLDSAARASSMEILIAIIGIVVAILIAALIAFLFLALATKRIALDAERRVPRSGKMVAIDGNRIHYIDEGEGQPILFIHGLGAQFHQFRQPLFHHFPDGFRLIALDRPGSGYSRRARGAGGTLTEQATVIRRFIETLKLERPLLVGHSLGGAIALATAILHPDSISGLALLSPHTQTSGKAPPGFEPLYIRSPLRRWLTAWTVAVPMARKYATQTLAFIFAPQKAPADYMTEGGGYLGLRPSHFYGTSTDFVDARRDGPELETRYGEIAMPVGILFGTADRVTDHEVHGLGMVGRISGLELELAEGVGHMPQYAEPKKVIAFIRRIAAKTA